MSIIFSHVIRSILELKLTCPRCKRDQIVSRKQREKAVKCKFCGADIPLPKNRR